MAGIKDGTYAIELPFNGGAITFAGEGRYLNLIPPGATDPKAQLVKTSAKGSTLKFVATNYYIGYNGDVAMNNKLVPSTEAKYFRIIKDSYEEGVYSIDVVDDPNFFVSMAMERIYPPWVAMLAFQEKQRWKFNEAFKANL